MTKSCKAFINHAFRESNLNRVEIRCAEKNLRSRAIPERLGFVKEVAVNAYVISFVGESYRVK